jgi:hypothetical protein
MTTTETSHWKRRLVHVRWIGGPPDAGKSTVTQLIESMYDVTIYRQDGHEREHIARADAKRFPRHAALREQIARSEAEFFESWVTTPLKEQAEFARLLWVERIPMICEDLAAFPNDRIIVAEGPGFFPGAIRGLLGDSRQAAWLLPTGEFKRASHARREKSAWREFTSNPELALSNHIERDILLAEIYRDELIEGDLVIDVDGSVDAETIARRVGTRFGLE